MNSYAATLESYIIIDNPDMIAIESIIYGAFESETSSVSELKTNLRRLAKAKAENDDNATREAKNAVDENIDNISEAAKNEKDNRKKEKLKKAIKIGAIIAGTLASAATINIAVNKIRTNSVLKQTLDLLCKQNEEATGEKPSKDMLREFVSDSFNATRGAPGMSDRKLNNTLKICNKLINKMDLPETDED